MKNANGVFFALTVASLGLACDGGGLKSQGSAKGGQSGSDASGGVLGQGGSGSGGAAAGGASGSGGGHESSGGSVAGGALGSGGIPRSGGGGGTNVGGSASGGRGGASAGGSGAGGMSGAGGTICLPIACPTIGCLYGYLPNPDPCGCPLCAPPDAGVAKDAAPDAADAECLHAPCPLVQCGLGYEISVPPCGCPTCAPVDGGQPDAVACPPIDCLAIACPGGTVPNPDPCGCPLCAPTDAAVEAAKLACVGLDECACLGASECRRITEACYNPSPQCNQPIAGICGGGTFIGCAPPNLATCADAKARVAGLCPQHAGPALDALCQQPDGGCIIKCLNEVGSCGDISCTLCVDCVCASDRFMTCLGECKAKLARK
jgi:hypothetical protein